MLGVTEAICGCLGCPGSINPPSPPPGRSQGDRPSLPIIDRCPDKEHDFISLQVSCDLLQEGRLLVGLDPPPPHPEQLIGGGLLSELVELVLCARSSLMVSGSVSA